MKLGKIVIIDYTGIDEFVHEQLSSLCDELVIYKDFPKSDEEIIERAKDAHAILVSWNTIVNKTVIDSLPKLKYVGMCCTLFDEKSANVDISACKKKNIVVKGVKDYGDEGVVEFIYSELIRLLKGSGQVQYQEEQIELGGLKLGIIGMGTLGKMVADMGRNFGMDVYYYNRTKKEEIPYRYLDLDQLLDNCHVVSTHLPRNVQIINEKEFEILSDNKILINTGILHSFDTKYFEKWIDRPGNFAIFDAVSVDERFKEKYNTNPNVIINNKVCGFTKNARKRLAIKVVENIEKFLNEED